MTKKGLICEVYRGEHDCTLNGISSKNNDVLLMFEEPEAQVFEESDNRPTLKIVRRNLFGREYIHAEPIGTGRAGHNSYMMGGNFLFSSDSRFSKLVSPYPIPIHDRQETAQEYEMLSR